LVFLTRNPQEQDRRRISLVAAAVGLLSCLLEGKSMESAFEEAQEQQEKKIRERTKELLKTNESLEVRILEHQRTEEALRGSQKNFSTLLNSIDGIIWNWI